MNEKILFINGNNFRDIEGFYSEIDSQFTKDVPWKAGHNLDAFNDLLMGGFGVYDYGESIRIVWKNAEKSQGDLGYKETIKYYERILHQSNTNTIRRLFNDAKEGKGKTLFEIIGRNY